MPEQFHSECLHKLCRVYGSYLQHSRAVYQCEDHRAGLLEVFHVDQASDVEHIHPPYFCEHCQAVLVKAAVAAKESKVYLHSVTTYEWSPHSDVHYQVCTHMAMQKKGGRPRKGRKNQGRPTANSAHARLKQLKDCTLAGSDREEHILVLHSVLTWKEEV